jgi:hypothetical protein
VTLKDYVNSPVKGTRIYTDSQGMRSRRRLADILSALHLSHDDLIWQAEQLQAGPG